MNVVFLPEVQEYYDYLEQILYEKGYFGSMEYSQRYVEELVYDIRTYLPAKQHEPAQNYFDKYGKDMYYASFRKNKQTTWYAFFNKYKENGKTTYLIRYIANNHTVAQYL